MIALMGLDARDGCVHCLLFLEPPYEARVRKGQMRTYKGLGGSDHAMARQTHPTQDDEGPAMWNGTPADLCGRWARARIMIEARRARHGWGVFSRSIRVIAYIRSSIPSGNERC